MKPENRTTNQPSYRIWVLALAMLAGANAGTSCPQAITARVSIDSPANGVILNQSSVLVTGSTTVRGPNMQLHVNGQSVPLIEAQPGFTWSTTVQLDPLAVLNPVEAVLTGGNQEFFIDQDRIMIIAGDSIPDGDPSPEAVALRINDSGLDDIEAIAGDLIDLDLAELLPVGTEVISDYCVIVFIGCIGSVDVRVANPSPSFGSFGLDADSMTNFLAGDVNISNIRVDLDVIGSGVAPSCGLRVTANSTDILGDYSLEPDGVDPSAIDVNLLPGSLSVSFTGFDSEFTSGLCDFPVVGNLIQAIIGNVEPQVLSGLEDFLDDPDGAGPADAPIADAIETALADVAIADPIGEALGLMVDAPIFAIPEDNDGFTLDSDFIITTEDGTGPGQCPIPPGAPDLDASYHVNEPFPAFGPLTPIGGDPYDVGLCVSSSAFNQLMKGITECGALNVVLTELAPGQPITAGLLGLAVEAFTVLPPSTPLEVRLDATTAPLITGNPGPAGELAEMKIGQLVAEIVQVVNSVDIVHLRLAADVNLGFDLLFDGVGLVPDITQPPVGDITLFILDNRINALPNQVLNQVPVLVAPVLPTLTDALGSIPIPELLGLQLSSVAVERNGQFMSIFMDASPAVP